MPLPSVYDTPMNDTPYPWGQAPDSTEPAATPIDTGGVAGNPAPASPLLDGVLAPASAWLLTGIATNWKRAALHIGALVLGLVLIGMGILAMAIGSKTVRDVASTAAAVAPIPV